MRTVLRALLICAATPVIALAQENPLSTFNRTAYGALKNILLRSAEKMPGENYKFQLTPAVRSFGQVIGHVAADARA